MTWMLAFQGFLFAAASLASDPARRPIETVVPLIGMAVAALSLLGVVAAYATIDDARRRSEKTAFGGTHWRRIFGRTNAIGIPLVVVIAWAAIFVMLH